MRAITSVFVVAALGVTLVACTAPGGDAGGGSATGDPVSGDCPIVASGAASDSVKISGELGSTPTVDIPAPLTVDTTQRSVIVEGDGDLVEPGSIVKVDYQLFNATSGESIGGTDFTGETAQRLPMDAEQLIPGIVAVIQCSTVGSRIVGALDSADAWGTEGQPQLGVPADTDIVVVADILEISPPPLERADGEDQAPVEGMPVVVLAENGAPTITIPANAPPPEFQLAVLKKGDGPVVEEGADVIVHYTGHNWNTDQVFDSSWERGAPATFNTRGVIGGFTAALEGQTVGSQVLVVIPPDQGYGAAGSPPNIGGTDTIVFVVDILGIA